MTDAEKLITVLIDEKKITGQEALILFKAVNEDGHKKSNVPN